ncbi:MAG: cache domain-containing protein [Hahellaceae bacterium]|nr:cache domain-containing protein [Hahellaceae bacterium]
MKLHADSQVKTWLVDPTLVGAVKAQNAANAQLTQSDIDKLDQAWRAETAARARPMIDKVLANPLSVFLKNKEAASQGLYTELFVMDNKGLNVGQSQVSSDYWQGDEDKWTQSYGKGAGAIHISDVEEDESTQTYQSQLSLPIADPDSGEVIGAITIGINVEGL